MKDSNGDVFDIYVYPTLLSKEQYTFWICFKLLKVYGSLDGLFIKYKALQEPEKQWVVIAAFVQLKTELTRIWWV